MKRASLNHIYRLVWSRVHQCYVAVAENTPACGKYGRVGVLAAALFMAANLQAAGLPGAGVVSAGSGSITQNASTMTINQSSNKLAIDWQSFSIGQGNTVTFKQPSATSIALNRVLGPDVSSIQGALNANGQVFLLNPNGVLFTPTAQVNAGGLVASTLNLNTADFLAGNYKFDGASSAAIINQGSLSAAYGGTIALIAAKISNDGNLTASGGNVLLGAGSSVTLDLGAPVKLQVKQGALDALIQNGGAIKADGGLVYLTASAAANLAATVINNTGLVEAQTLSTGQKGKIYLLGGMGTDSVLVGGKLDASAPNGGDGGFIETSASHVNVTDTFSVTTQSSQGKSGLWLLDPIDYTIAATGGNITGTLLASNLKTTDVTIVTTGTGGNGDILVNDNVNVSGGSAIHTLTLKADRNIVFNANNGIDATGNGFGINTILWANALNTGGYVSLGIGSQLKTNGGHLWIGGGNGTVTWNGLAVGNGYAQGMNIGNLAGIYISNGVIATNGGNIAMYGKSVAGGTVATNPDGQANASGIVTSFNEQYSIDSGIGTIYLNGVGTDTNNAHANGDALYFNGGTITSAAASGNAITLVGDSSTATTSNVATGITLVSWDALKSNSMTATGGGNIVMTGSGGLSTALSQAYSMGIRMDQVGAGINTISTTGSGNISLTGTTQRAASYSIGATNANTNISAAGNLTVTGNGSAVNLLAKNTVNGTTTLSATGQNITANNTLNDYVGAVTATGAAVNLYDSNALLLGGASTSTSFLAQSVGAMTLNSGSSITASANNNITLAAGGTFTNAAGAAALGVSGTGVYQVYSTTPAGGNRGGLTPGFIEYGKSYGNALSGTGNAFVYSTTPTLSTTLTGTVSKNYDQSNAATLAAANYVLNGVLGGDAVTLNTVSSGAYADANAGTGKTVSVSGLTLNVPTNIYGYSIAATASGAIGAITQKSLTATYTAGNKVYDGTTTASVSGSVAGVMAGDTVTFSQTAADFSDKNVGTAKTVNISGISLGGASMGNYSLSATTASTTANITPRALTVSGINAGNKVYDGSTLATVNTTGMVYTGLVSGDQLSANVTGRFVDGNVGRGKIVTLTTVYAGLDVGNYSIGGQLNATADITQNTALIQAVGGVQNPVGGQSSVVQSAGTQNSAPSGLTMQTLATSGLELVDLHSKPASADKPDSRQPLVSAADTVNAAGFMKVFVVDGGVNLPSTAQ